MNRFNLCHYLLIVSFIISCSNNRNYLPEVFCDMHLTKKLSGKEAEGFVNNLHFQKVANLESDIGFYNGKAGNSTINITHYNTEESAINNYKKMVKKISPGNQVFIRPEYLKLVGMEIFRCFGMGQSHYVFPYNKKLFWISVNNHWGKKFVENYLNYMK